MNLSEIENLNAAELKAKRITLVEEAAQSEPRELAARYVKARIDASSRDEKLAEQGKTISSLNEALEAQKKATADANQRAAQLTEALQTSRDQVRATAQTLHVAANDRDLARQVAAKAQALAAARRAALVDVLDFANQLNAKVGKLLVTED